MRKKSDTQPAVAGARSGAAGKRRARGTTARQPNDGGRAVPGKVSRGPFHFVQDGGFSGLGRIILDKLDRGVVLLDRRSSVAAERKMALAARVRRSKGASYRVVITPVPEGADERDVSFVALIYAPDELRDMSTDVLRELYALTPAQAQVARSLFAGRSVEESAAALNLSLNTVRTHLKQIFTRCEVQSQAELLHLLAQGPQHL